MLEQVGADCRFLDGRTGEVTGAVTCIPLSRDGQVNGSSASIAICAPLEKPARCLELVPKSSSIEIGNFIMSSAETRGGLDDTGVSDARLVLQGEVAPINVRKPEGACILPNLRTVVSGVGKGAMPGAMAVMGVL
jgi:hypothetical protein